jgi:hypothetical protein
MSPSACSHLRGFGGDDGHRVADAVRHLSHGDHGRPVGDDAAGEALSGYVAPGGGNDHSRECERGRHVERQEARTGVRRSQHGAEEHAGLREIVDVPCLSPDLQRRVDAEPSRTDPGSRRVGCRGNRGVPGQPPPVACGEEHPRDDLRVSGASADVPPQRGAGFRLARVVVAIEEGFCRHHHAGGAESALDRLRKGAHVDVHLGGGNPFDRHDRPASNPLQGDGARGEQRPVDEHGTRPAGSFAARLPGPREPGFLAQVREQGAPALGFGRDAVQRESHHAH